MSSLTKNGIDHSHQDVHWGRYVGAERNIFIWRRHLQTKDPSRDNITAQYRNDIQAVSRNLGGKSKTLAFSLYKNRTKRMVLMYNLVGNYSLHSHKKLWIYDLLWGMKEGLLWRVLIIVHFHAFILPSSLAEWWLIYKDQWRTWALIKQVLIAENREVLLLKSINRLI